MTNEYPAVTINERINGAHCLRRGGVAQLARASGSYPECRWFKSDRRYHMARWSSGQDIALSRRRQEFDSPTGHHLWVLSSAGRAHASHAWGRGFKSPSTHHVRGINSVVECHLAKVKVASPNLVSRSTLLADDHSSASVLWHHSQVARQRSAKPLFPSSSLGGASKDLLQREILFFPIFSPSPDLINSKFG